MQVSQAQTLVYSIFHSIFHHILLKIQQIITYFLIYKKIYDVIYSCIFLYLETRFAPAQDPHHKCTIQVHKSPDDYK